MKKLVLLTAAAVATIAMATTAFAATGWQQSTDGRWWYSLTESGGSWYHGTNGVPQWQWLDGNRDGVAECYAFDNDGWMYANTTTPDGYLVNANGAWVSGGVVQTQSTSGSTSSAGVGWRLGANGRWWYATNAAGTTYHVGTPIAPYWAWIDGNGDGISESYAFDALGYMYANTTTPDGYVVNADGAWTVNGAVQTRRSSSSATVRSVSSGGGSSSGGSSSSGSSSNTSKEAYRTAADVVNKKTDITTSAESSSNGALDITKVEPSYSGTKLTIATTGSIARGKTVADVANGIAAAIEATGSNMTDTSKVVWTVTWTNSAGGQSSLTNASDNATSYDEAKNSFITEYGSYPAPTQAKITLEATYKDSSSVVFTFN